MMTPTEGSSPGWGLRFTPQGRFRELAAEGFTPFYRVEFTPGADGKARGAQAVSPLASRHELLRAAQ